MKKLILKFWVINFLSIIILFIITRIIFMKTITAPQNWFEKIFHIFYILLNMSFTMIFAAVMFISSLTIFLNFNTTIRKKYFLSLLAFLGIPLIGGLYFIVVFLIKMFSSNSISEYISTFISGMYPFLAFPFTYLLFISLEFLLFRKLIKKQEAREQTHIIK